MTVPQGRPGAAVACGQGRTDDEPVTVDGPGLALYPDRQVRADPRERAIARRSYQAVHDLPVIVRQPHVDPWLLLDADTVTAGVAGCPREVFTP
jgi:hypothetical protein